MPHLQIYLNLSWQCNTSHSLLSMWKLNTVQYCTEKTYPQHVIKEAPAIAPPLARFMNVKVKNTEWSTLPGPLIRVK